MRVYISGPITGIADYNKPAFARAAEWLKEAGYSPVNPHDIGVPSDVELPWEEYLRADLRELLDCNGVALLHGHDKSRGAQLEQYVARQLKMQVMPLRYWLERPFKVGRDFIPAGHRDDPAAGNRG